VPDIKKVGMTLLSFGIPRF